MIETIIYLAVAALVIWSVVYLARHIRRQLRGDCGCGDQSCFGECTSCGKNCQRKKKDT